jgi:hypothetical protein
MQERWERNTVPVLYCSLHGRLSFIHTAPVCASFGHYLTLRTSRVKKSTNKELFKNDLLG